MIKEFIRKYSIAPILIIVLLVYGLYAQAVGFDFVSWDDDYHVTQNQFIQKLDAEHVKLIFSTTVNKIYIPLTQLSFAVEHYFYQFNPAYYHFHNILLHIAVTILIFVFALKLKLSKRTAFFASLIFGLHPMHVESVAWVTERKDVLYSFFYMLALIFYCDYLNILNKGVVLDGRERKVLKLFLIILLLSVLSVLSKPMALSIPFVLLVLDWYFKRKFSLRLVFEKLYCLVLISPIVWMTYSLQMRTPAVNLYEGYLRWLWCFSFYLRKFMYPDFYVLIYKSPYPISLESKHVMLSFFIFSGVLLLLIKFWKRRLFTLSFLIYFCSIFFLLRFDVRNDINVVADRFMYLPSLGFCLLFGYFLDTFIKRNDDNKSAQMVIYLALILGGAFLVSKTDKQIKVWKNSTTLWEHQLNFQREAATVIVYNKLAESYITEVAVLKEKSPYIKTDDEKRLEYLRGLQIKRLLELALEIKPDYANGYFNLGRYYELYPNIEMAYDNYKTCIQMEPSYSEAYLNLGRLHLKMLDPEVALIYLGKAINSNPDYKGMYLKVMDVLREVPKDTPGLKQFSGDVHKRFNQKFQS